MKTAICVLTLLTSSFAVANTAVHISEFGCGMLNAKGGSFYATESRVTVSPTSTGITVLKCIANNVTNTTGRSVHWNYDNTSYMCNTNLGATTNWSQTISANGDAVLTCTVRG